MDLDYLLSPYVSTKETERRWKEYLEKNGRKTTFQEIEKLATEIHKKYNMPKESISCLFNRSYRSWSPEEREWPSLKQFKPPSFKGFEKLEFSDLSLVEEIVSRLSYPKECPIEYGPNNGDYNAGPKWCHEYSDEYEDNVNHGMYRCTCFCEIPHDYFFCHACRTKIPWHHQQFTRMPIADEESGGWGEFYCSKECLMEFLKPSEMQTLILDVVESCTE